MNRDHDIISLQKNNPDAAVIEAVVNKLLCYVTADLVFIAFNESATPSTFTYTVTVLAQKEQLSPEFYEMADALPFIRYRIFSLLYVEEAIKDSNLYFTANCLLGELVYSNPASQKAFYNGVLNPKKLLDTAIKNFAAEKEKFNAFRQGAEFYMQNGNYPQAIFTFHQSIELMFRTLGYFMMGKSLIAHSLESQQKYIKKFVPDFPELFDVGNAHEYRLLSLLDQSYLSVRYDNNFEVSTEQLQDIAHKVQLMSSKVEALFQLEVSKIAAKGILIKIKEPDKVMPETVPVAIVATSGIAPPPPEILQQIFLILDGFITVDAIYCLGHRKRMLSVTSAFHKAVTETEQLHYDLLVITEHTDQAIIADLSDIVRTKTNDRCTVTLLLHKLSWLQESPDARDYFIYNVLQNGELVYHRPDFTATTFTKIPKRDIGAIRKYWENRKIMALTFLKTSESMQCPTGELVQEVLLHQAVEQLCLGLINTFLGYRPHYFALGYLFDLCENFNTLTTAIFPRYTMEDKRLFRRLTANLSQLRYSEPENTDPIDTGILYKRSRCFYEQTVALVESELEQISADLRGTI